MMTYAIKASERDDAIQRAVASVIFAPTGTLEAITDLKKLAQNSDSSVASLASEMLSEGPLTDTYIPFRSQRSESIYQTTPSR
jgi:HEAT repeat protein